MAVIPRGEQFGQVQVQPVRMGGIGGPSTAVAEGLGDLGAGVKSAYDQDQQLKNLQAGNAVLDRQFQVRTLTDDIGRRLRDGSLPFTDAQKAYQEGLTKLPPAEFTGLNAQATEHINQTMRRLDMAGLDGLTPAINESRRATFKQQIDIGIDTIGKQVSLGADVAGLNKQLNAYDQQGAEAYGLNWPKVKQDAIDKNWYNHLSLRAIQSRDNLDALRQLETELSDPKGQYADKLDADRRNAILRGVITERTQVENRIQLQADRREAAATRVIGQVSQQTASGVPITADQWQQWQVTVKGTSQEPELRALMQEETAIQNVLRMPIDQQSSYVQQRRAELTTKGGSVRDLNNLNRLENVVTANVKQLQEQPLLYAQNRTGVQVQPLDFNALMQPGGADKMREQMQSRLDTIRATQKQYGDQVKLRPLLPQEAAGLASVLSGSDPRQARDLLAVVRKTVGDDTAFQAAMQQIAPDSPVKALAGILASKQRSLTLESNVISPDITATSGDVALTLLTGESILNKTKDQKGADGQAKAFPLPKESDFELMFSDKVGNAFAGMPGRYQIAMQAVRAYYTGAAAQAGDVSGQLDNNRMKQAIRAVVGNPVSVGAGGTVIAPWGMDESDFEDRAQEALRFALKNKGISGVPESLQQYGLQNGNKDGEYLIRMGRNYLTDAKGGPVTINVLAPASSWGRAK